MAASFRPLLLVVILLAQMSAAAAVRVKGFSFSGVSNRFITPNGDGKNDNVAFNFSNPSDSAGTVKIYDLRGHLVSTIPISAGTNACGTVLQALFGTRVLTARSCRRASTST